MTDRNRFHTEGQVEKVEESVADPSPSISRASTGSRPTPRRSSTARSGSRRTPTIGVHDDYAAHTETNEADLIEDEADRASVKQGASAQDAPAVLRQHDKNSQEEVEKPDSRSSLDGNGPNDLDLESGPPTLSRQTTVKSARSAGSQAFRDPNLVSWSGPDDPENPKNWTLKRKWGAVVVVSAFTL